MDSLTWPLGACHNLYGVLVQNQYISMKKSVYLTFSGELGWLVELTFCLVSLTEGLKRLSLRSLATSLLVVDCFFWLPTTQKRRRKRKMKNMTLIANILTAYVLRGNWTRIAMAKQQRSPGSMYLHENFRSWTVGEDCSCIGSSFSREAEAAFVVAEDTAATLLFSWLVNTCLDWLFCSVRSFV